MYPVLSGILVGLLVGLRHAFEPDHLAAVSTMVAQRPNRVAAAGLGAWWGLGHSIALALVSGALVVAGLSVPPRYDSLFELVVGAMLVGMGGRALWRSLGAAGPTTWHVHGTFVHQHSGPIQHLHLGRRVLAWRPLLVGLVHGVAGSGALTAVVMAELPNNAARAGYIVLFGLGSIAGMALMSGIAGDALSRLSRAKHVARVLSASTGLLALAVGGVWSARALGSL
jgi:hypothetical protein